MEKRKFKRHTFDSQKKLLLKINNEEFEIENISQGGIKFLKGKTLRFTDAIAGKVVFPDGEAIDIEGNIAWEQEDVIGLSFKEIIPEEILQQKEQVAFLQTKISIPRLVTSEKANLSAGYSRKILKQLGIKADLIEEWMDNGYIEPNVIPKTKSDSENIFSRFDLYAVKLFDYLLKRGFSEEEASLRVKILILAEKKPGRHLYNITFILFSRKVDFTLVPDELKKKMRLWLFDKKSLDPEDCKDAKDNLKNFIPALIQESNNKLSVSAALFKNCDDILIVNFRKIRDEVNKVIGEE